MTHFVEQYDWQLAEIQAGIEEAKNNIFATDTEIAAVFNKYISNDLECPSLILGLDPRIQRKL